MSTRPKHEISRQTLRALKESRPNNYGQYLQRRPGSDPLPAVSVIHPGLRADVVKARER